MRRQARRTAARSARRRDRPVAKTSTASAASMPFPAARARPGAGPATPAAAITSTKTSRKRSDASAAALRSEEHTSELQSPDHLVCRLLLEKKKNDNAK